MKWLYILLLLIATPAFAEEYVVSGETTRLLVTNEQNVSITVRDVATVMHDETMQSRGVDALRIDGLSICGPGVLRVGGNGVWSYGLRIVDCQHVLIEDLTILVGFGRGMFLTNCKHVVIRNCRVIAMEPDCVTDGIDPSGCRHVLVEHCYVDVTDDGICVKSSDSATDGVRVENNIVRSKTSALKISNVSHPVSNVVFVRNHVLDADRAFTIYRIRDRVQAEWRDNTVIRTRMKGQWRPWDYDPKGTGRIHARLRGNRFLSWDEPHEEHEVIQGYPMSHGGTLTLVDDDE